MKSVFAALLFFAFAAGASAQSGVRAELLWYGLYTAGETKSFDDPTSPTGKRHESTGIQGPRVSDDRIALGEEVRFGFGYVIRDGRRGDKVRTRHIYRHPAIPGRDGKLQRTTTIDGEDEVGVNSHIGWRLGGQEARDYEGEWTLEVWSGNRKLLSQRFTLYRR